VIARISDQQIEQYAPQELRQVRLHRARATWSAAAPTVTTKSRQVNAVTRTAALFIPTSLNALLSRKECSSI
jgi:hypothetical protein